MTPLVTVCVLAAVSSAAAYSPSQQPRPNTRRTFLVQIPAAAAAVVTSNRLTAPHDTSCTCASCQHDDSCSCGTCRRFGWTPPAAMAYERRDVGGADRSADTAALNEQAYQTQNRLEKEGFRLETEQEQIASLSAALSDYSYSPGDTNSKSTNKNDAARKDRK